MSELMEKTEISKSVEDYLNAISYASDPDYVPSPFALAFVAFIKLVNGEEGEEHSTPVSHFRMLDTVVSPDSNVANMCARGLAKTTLMGEYLILYIATYGDLPEFGSVNLGLYVSDSIENGVKNMRKNLEHRWENSDFLKKYVPHAKFTDIRWEFINLEGHKTVFKGYGAKTGVRGAKEMGIRPQIALLDDLVSDEDARSATVVASIEDTVYKAVTYALHPTHYKIIWNGTPFNARDPLYKAVESGAWAVNVFPVCEEFPCSKEDFRGAWPDRFTYDYVEKMYNRALQAGKIDTFNQELMLRIMSAEERLIEDHEIGWYKHKMVLDNRGAYNFYITSDFANTEKSAGDYSVISVWAYNNNGDWFWVDGICKRQLMDKNIDDLFRLVQIYKPQAVGIEISGQQKGYIPWIDEQMGVRNIYFTIAQELGSTQRGFRPSTNKFERFGVVVPLFKLHKIRFPKELQQHPAIKEALDELTLASRERFKSKHDDFLDTISQLAMMNAWKPSQVAPRPDTESQKYWDDWEPEREDGPSVERYIV
jgi:predicted phage terminase large subunit-like protein